VLSRDEEVRRELTWIPAPISPNSEAASRTVTLAPARERAIAAARPPMPAPQRPTWRSFFDYVFG
jgi:hypothetical protein